MNDWIETYTGRQFHPLDPNPEDICIEDVAHALSLLCRYTGHCRVFMSVAAHGLYVSRLVPAQDAKWGLLHDASEAYLADVARPVKQHLVNYVAAEAQLMKMVAERFGLPWPIPESVHQADLVMLATEKRDLMLSRRPWACLEGVEPLEEQIIPMSPGEAENEFLARYQVLFNGSNTA